MTDKLIEELKKTYYENYGLDIHAKASGRLADDIWKWLEKSAFQRVREDVVKKNMDALKKDVWGLPAVSQKYMNGESVGLITKYQVLSAINCYPHTPVDDEINSINTKEE